MEARGSLPSGTAPLPGDPAARKRQIELRWQSLEAYMQANTFDVIERRKHITFFKLGKLWVFKQFFDNHELFNALLDYTTKNYTVSSSNPPA